VRDRYDAVVLMGPPGAGKSFLGRKLHERGVASYRELEPMLREKFGSGEEFESRIREAGAFIWQSYRDQLSASELPVAFESAGVAERPLLEALQRDYRVALVHVRADRSVCIDRVVSRPPSADISHTTDREAIGRYYDLWQEKILPTYRFVLSVDGADPAGAVAAIGDLLGRDLAE
jgi:adenylate kinase family enzyme